MILIGGSDRRMLHSNIEVWYGWPFNEPQVPEQYAGSARFDTQKLGSQAREFRSFLIIQIMKNKKSQSFNQVSIITNEYRALKRDQLFLTIRGNPVLREIPENQLHDRVKDIENAIHNDHNSNAYLYNQKIEKIIHLFKQLNQHSLTLTAYRLKADDLKMKSIMKIIDKYQNVMDCEQKLRKPKPKMQVYNPLNPQPLQPRAELIAEKVTVVKAKKNPSSSAAASSGLGSFGYKIYNEVASFGFSFAEPELRKKIKPDVEEEEEVIRINDGMKGAPEQPVYVAKQMQLLERSQKYSLFLLTELPPRYTSFPEKLEAKLFPAQQTVQYLRQNLERRIVFGQILLKQSSPNAAALHDLGQRLQKEDKIIAQKYDSDNATLLIMTKDQLIQILKARKQSLNLDSNEIVIKEWATSQSYLNWFVSNFQYMNHQLYFLVHYKRDCQETTRFDKLTIQQLGQHPQLQQQIENKKQSQEVEQLLNGFMQVEFIIGENPPPIDPQPQTLRPPSPPSRPLPQPDPPQNLHPPTPKPPLKDSLIFSNLAIKLPQEDYF